MRDRYETLFGIYNHANPIAYKPLALIALHWCEDNVTGGTLRERMEQFAEREVFKRFGVSFTDFINMSTNECLDMLELAAKYQKELGAGAKDLLDSMGH